MADAIGSDRNATPWLTTSDMARNVPKRTKAIARFPFFSSSCMLNFSTSTPGSFEAALTIQL